MRLKLVSVVCIAYLDGIIDMMVVVRTESAQITPTATKPGELVQVDTIHYICPVTYKRRYVYTVIDPHTRMAYAEVHSRILPGKTTQVIDNAQALFGFTFAMAQTDNDPEFGRYFAQRMTSQDITVRHSRLCRPNDNAHIERFNRTIQEECLGSRLAYKTKNHQVQARPHVVSGLLQLQRS